MGEMRNSGTPDRTGCFFLLPKHIPCWCSSPHFLWGCLRGPQITLVDDRECPVGRDGQGDASLTPPTPVDLELEWVLGKMPQKVWGWGGMCFLWPSRRTGFPLPVFVTCAQPSQVLLFGHSSVTGVLPPEGAPCAAASGPAPGSERAPGSRTRSKAACCGQQALPHQQGPPGTWPSALFPVLHPGPPLHWGVLGFGNEGAGECDILNSLLFLLPTFCMRLLVLQGVASPL